MNKKKATKTWGGARAGSGSKKRLETVGTEFRLVPLDSAGVVRHFRVIEKRDHCAVVQDTLTGTQYALEREN